MIVQIKKILYAKLKNAYNAIGGFADGSYLMKTEFESKSKYEIRQALNSYNNMMQTVVDNNILPLFGDVRRDSKNKLIQDFIANADGQETPLSSLMRQYATEAELYGWILVFLESPPEQGKFLSDAKIPFLKRFIPQEIEEYQLNNQGKVQYIAWIGYDDSGESDYFSYYEGNIYKGIIDLDNLSDANIYAENVSTPDILSFRPNVDRFHLPASAYNSILQSLITIYQLESYIAYQGCRTSFSIFQYPGKVGANGIVFGEETIVQTPEGGNAGFLTPDNTMDRIREQIECLRKYIYEQADLSILFTDSSASGESKKASDLMRQQNLKSKSRVMDTFENKIIEKYKLLTGQTKESDLYSLSYPDTFESLTLSTRIADAAVLIKEIGISDASREMVSNDIIQQWFISESPEVKEALRNGELGGSPNQSAVGEKLDNALKVEEIGTAPEVKAKLTAAALEDSGINMKTKDMENSITNNAGNDYKEDFEEIDNDDDE